MAIARSPSSISPLQFRRTASLPFPFSSSLRQIAIKNRRKCLSPLNSSLEKEERETEIERETAREALRKLDQQLQSLSQTDDLPKKRSAPIPPPEPELDQNLISRDGRGELPEISDSYLAYTAVALVLLTIFNNIIFNSFVKPSVNGVEKVTKIERTPLTEPE